jgi:hypothetical protein
MTETTHKYTSALKAPKAPKGSGLSPCVKSAIADPDGVSAALLEYGRLTRYPEDGCLPVRTKEGRRAWVSAIYLARPLDMGLAWERIEQRESNAMPT